jgi:hypothetical protein
MNNEQKIIATKLGLLKLAERLGNVSEACKVMGYSRDSFYLYQGLKTRSLLKDHHFSTIDTSWSGSLLPFSSRCCSTDFMFVACRILRKISKTRYCTINWRLLSVKSTILFVC